MYLLPVDLEDVTIDRLMETTSALRKAVRYRNPENGRRHFCHLPEFRSAFISALLERRHELKRRAQQQQKAGGE